MTRGESCAGCSVLVDGSRVVGVCDSGGVGESRAVYKEVFRLPPGWAYAFVACAVISLAIPVWNQFLRDPRMDPSSRLQNLVICVVVAAAFLRASRMRVEASQDGITVLRMRPAAHIPWADVTGITVKPHRFQGEGGFNDYVAIGQRAGKDVGAPALNPDWGKGRWGPGDQTERAIDRLTALAAEHNPELKLPRLPRHLRPRCGAARGSSESTPRRVPWGRLVLGILATFVMVAAGRWGADRVVSSIREEEPEREYHSCEYYLGEEECDEIAP